MAEQPDSEQDVKNRPANEGLPLPDPFPEYVVCPHCGELEVEVWCYQKEVQCHQCGQLIQHKRPPCYGSSPICRGVAD